MTDPSTSADGPEGRTAAKGGMLDRLRSGIQPRGPRPSAKAATTKWQIDRLDDRERRISFAASVAALLFGVVIYLVQTNNSHFRLSKGQLTPQTTLILGIVFGALLAVATFIGRRAPVGFVALFCFLAFGTLIGAPFLVLAAWLLYRSYKFQKEASNRLKQANAGAKAAPSSAPSTRRTAQAKPRPATGKPRAKGPATPEANKRFTPKRPAPPPPKPSRRDRKAADASE